MLKTQSKMADLRSASRQHLLLDDGEVKATRFEVWKWLCVCEGMSHQQRRVLEEGVMQKHTHTVRWGIHWMTNALLTTGLRSCDLAHVNQGLVDERNAETFGRHVPLWCHQTSSQSHSIEREDVRLIWDLATWRIKGTIHIFLQLAKWQEEET